MSPHEHGGAEHLRTAGREGGPRRPPTRSTGRSWRARPSTRSTRRSTASLAVMRAAGRPAEGVPGRAPHGHQRQDVDVAHGRAAGARARPAHRPVHQPAPDAASTSGSSIDGEPISDERFVEVWQDVAPYVHLVDQRSARGGRAAAVVLRGVHGDGLRGVRGRPGRRRGDRGRHGRLVGLDQRRRRRGRDHHADLDGPRALPRRHAARHRVGEGGDHQGRRDAGPRRAAGGRRGRGPGRRGRAGRPRGARGRRHRGRSSGRSRSAAS